MRFKSERSRRSYRKRYETSVDMGPNRPWSSETTARSIWRPAPLNHEYGHHPPLLGGWPLKTNRPEPKSPSITEDGLCDPAQFPIDPVLKKALSDDRREFHSAVSLLRSMYNNDRKEAGVFLIGLLLT